MAITESDATEGTDLTRGRTRRDAGLKLRRNKKRERGRDGVGSYAAPPVMTRRWKYILRALVLITFLAAWEYLPKVDWLNSRISVFDPFFISSPSLIAERVWEFLVPGDGAASIWPFLAATVKAALVGFVAGAGSGFLVGLMLSNMPRVNAVLRIFIVGINSVPRVALIPLVIVIVGPGGGAALLMSLLVVFFLTFYNAYEGGVSVPKSILQNAQVMDAPPSKIVLQVRLPYVVLWTFAALPNALAFSLLVAVATEMISGSSGTGGLLLRAAVNLDPTTTFAILVYLSLTGVLFLSIANLGKRRLLHWAPGQSG